MVQVDILTWLLNWLGLSRVHCCYLTCQSDDPNLAQLTTALWTTNSIQGKGSSWLFELLGWVWDDTFSTIKMGWIRVYSIHSTCCSQSNPNLNQPEPLLLTELSVLYLLTTQVDSTFMHPYPLGPTSCTINLMSCLIGRIMIITLNQIQAELWRPQSVRISSNLELF